MTTDSKIFYKEKFKAIRESLNMTQKDIAERLSITPQAIQKWEDGLSAPRKPKIYKLAELLHCKVSDLCDMYTPENFDAAEPEAESRERRIIIDLAQRIEQRGRERYAVKSANIRKRMMEVMESGWPHSCDKTLVKMAILILSETKPGEEEIFAEIRELNSDIVPSERPMVPCPY